MSNFQHHAKKRMGDPSIASAKYKATERFSFGWTDPRAIFRKGVLIVTTHLEDFAINESYTFTLGNEKIEITVTQKNASEAEQLSLHEIKDLWAATYVGEPASLKSIEDNQFVAGAFLRLCRAGLIGVDWKTRTFALK